MTKHVVMFSGGAASWATAKRVAYQHGTENLTLLFADTLVEDADLYRFLDEAAANVGAPMVRIADGRTPWEVFEAVKYIGNSRVDPCSMHLKRDLLDRWLIENCDPASTVVYVGLSWYEPHRGERLIARKAAAGWTYEAPMMAEPHHDPETVLQWMTLEGIRPPRLYAAGFTHNNCGGFCIKAGHASFAKLLTYNRPYYLENEAHEERLRAQGINGTVLSDRRGDNRKKPLTMRAFRLRLETDAQAFDPNDVGGCGCALE